MTDKEIICHGVDVSKCDRLNLNFAYGWDDEDTCSITCCKNSPKCSFKQLVRKTQECEKLNEEVEYSHNQNIRWSKAWAKMWSQRNRYRKALEKIKTFINDDMCELCRVGYICGEYDEAYYKDKCKECNYSIILDIISKAKGEGNNE